MSIRGKSILIIDDDAAMLRALHRVLKDAGAMVTDASWVGEATDHLTSKSARFDLIITDLRMPILGGESILAAGAVALPHIPMIVITAFGTPEARAECLNKGAAAFLEKPLDTAQLLDAVERALRGRTSNFLRRALRRKAMKKPNPQVEIESDFLGGAGRLGCRNGS
jgi:DNA-binding NtrC family response regulator